MTIETQLFLVQKVFTLYLKLHLEIPELMDKVQQSAVKIPLQLSSPFSQHMDRNTLPYLQSMLLRNPIRTRGVGNYSTVSK